MNIGIDITQIVNSTVANIESQLEGRARDASYALQNHLVDVIRDNSGTGRIYHKPTGGTYRASSAGDPPVNRLGTMRGSWRPATTSITPVLETHCRYAAYLEEGTSKMAPRPYKEKTIEAAMPEIEAIYGAPFV